MVTEETIARVGEMICEDNRSTFKETEAKKISSRLVLHNLTDAQKCIHIGWCEDMLDKFEDRNSQWEVRDDPSVLQSRSCFLRLFSFPHG